MTAATDLTRASAVVLAGGRGTRLQTVVADRPKVLADVQGRPFLTYVLDPLSAAGGGTIVLCTGHLGEQVQETLGPAYGTRPLTYAQEPHPLGTGGALRAVLPQLHSDPVLVLNGDSYCPADLGALWAWHAARGEASGTLLLTHVDDTRRYGQVAVDADGCIERFVEKGTRGGPGWINAGIYVLSRRLLTAIPAGRAVSLEREVFPAWVGRGLHGLSGPDRFLDIGTPLSYQAAQQFGAWS
ncbi:MAG: nucleotidyltransferase family protein [Candidatus Binatia bacterium]